MNPIVSQTASALATVPVDARAAAVVKSIAEGKAKSTLPTAATATPCEPARRTENGQLKTTTAGASPGSEQETFFRLAALTPTEYDRQREAEAEKLGIRCSTLDAAVAKCRPQSEGSVQGEALDFPPLEPWPHPVNGAELLTEVANTFTKYVALPPHAAVALTLWTAMAHCFDSFLHSPRLNLYSPEKGCGKTLLLDVLVTLTPRPLRTESITPAVLFRLVDLYKPVLLLDEHDTYLQESEELRGLLNAGHKRGAKAFRCEGDRHEVRSFSAYAPAVLAGIGHLPGTLHDRSIIIQLVRAKPGEVTVRFDSRRTLAEAELCRKLARWTGDNRPQLESLDPHLPEGAFNRQADNWRPLFAIAQTAGGDWPAQAAAAFTAMTAADSTDEHGIAASLLADIRTIYTDAEADRLASTQIAEALGTMDGKPWPEFKHGNPITPNQIARLLRRFNICSRTIRLAGTATAKGYYLADFDDAFARFLPPISKRNTVTTIENIDDSSLFETSQPEGVLPFENKVSPNDSKGCDGVTLSEADNAQMEVLV